MNRSSPARLPLRRRQYGLTLVEIMVAITISLLLLAGVIQIFLSNKASHGLQNGMGRLQEDVRAAMDVLDLNIGMAGYTTGTTAINAINTANTLNNSTENSSLGFTAASGKASDVIEINYTSATDCLGQATGGTATDRYYLSGTNLMCLGSGSATAGIIAEGIENMQILYGEDSDDDGIANRYINATNIAANPIVSVRIALLASTIESMGATDTATYALLNTPLLGPFNDNQLRRVFTRTIVLRNS
jgi:type IV pilus assembly protein PilW